MSENNIKSISQLHKEMVQKKYIIIKQIEQLSIPNLPPNIDFQTKNITIDKIFQMIPSQEKLKTILQNQGNQRKKKLQYYDGEYQIVKKAAQRADSIKPQARQIYKLFANLDLPKIKDNFKQAKQNNSIKLDSFDIQNKETFIKSQRQFEEKAEDRDLSTKTQSIKATKFQRNTISEDYLYSVKESQKYQQILPPSQYLKDDQLLVHVCVYDSLNGQKQHEFIFLGDMKLIELKKQIYCKIQKLQTNQSTNNDKKIHHLSQDQKCFFLIEQNLYYQGTHHSQQQIDALIKNIKLSYQADILKFSMNLTQIKNLRVVFGRPYLFRHLGGCDHMIVFKDLRLYDKNSIEPDIRKKYPFMVFESKMKRRKCEGCDINFAAFICVGDKLKNGHTSYLCRQCHQNIHNDLTNAKNRFMKVIPYLHE